jgi:hypothetical protein
MKVDKTLSLDMTCLTIHGVAEGMIRFMGTLSINIDGRSKDENCFLVVEIHEFVRIFCLWCERIAVEPNILEFYPPRMSQAKDWDEDEQAGFLDGDEPYILPTFRVHSFCESSQAHNPFNK